MVTNASVAGSDIDTHDGFAVMTSVMQVVIGGSFLATKRRVISVSVTIPASPPSWSVMIAASQCFAAISCTISRTLLSV